MANVLVDRASLQDVADAIRAKKGLTTTKYKPAQMGEAVLSIQNSYAAGDEGKVVSNGALVAQSSATYTENDTYDTTLIDEVTVNVSGGGGGTDSTFRVKNFVMPSAKFVSQNCVPNTLGNGGCLHFIYTLQTNTSTSNDLGLICCGVGALSAWSPGTTTPSMYIAVGKNSNTVVFYLRGPGNVNIYPTGLADASDRINIKLYSDHYVDVNTGTSYEYTSGQQTFMTELATKTYLSIGCNQSNPFSGATIELFALETA